MCGFAGFLGGQTERESAQHILARMAGTLTHRGPDYNGLWHEGSTGLAHTRLSIIDPSSAGRQPMESASGRYVIAFNGEIYNHLALRSELNAPWRGHSDTETMLAACETWGIVETLKRCSGMFAFALWDRYAQTLTLARDRLGEKPLYYGWQGSGNAATFLFGSELKALRAHPAFVGTVDRNSLALYVRHAYVPSPYSIYHAIHVLRPGHVLTVSLEMRDNAPVAYWSGMECALKEAAMPFSGTREEAVDALEIVLKEAVKQQMVADVPVGAFLSGGIDSSTITALMQAQSTRPIKTFSIGFHEKAYDEAPHAAAIARHLGTDHTELYVTAQEARDVIPNLPSLYDEPFADSSQIPVFLVSALARGQVKVSLSGDGGDELFGGYNRYRFTASAWNHIARIPLPLRSKIAECITRISPSLWDHSMRLLTLNRFKGAGDKIHKIASILHARTIEAVYMQLISQWQAPETIVIGGKEPPTLLTGNRPAMPGLNNIETMMALDMLTYLPDDILTKVDRASMGVSLETRAPFLDPRVVALAWSLPLAYKLRGAETKWALKQVAYRHVPKTLLDRPKMGFGVPIDSWLRNGLREWAESLLNEKRLEEEGYFHPAPIRQKWQEHLSGKRNWQHALWNVLMFQSWLERQRA